MTFISYAQNFEDVMLWRALKHIQNGFYVDVGANDPTELSVTRAFYDQGWSGINIEPVYSCFEKLKTERTRDINLNLVAGKSDGEIVFYEMSSSALSTTDSDLAQRYAESGTPVRKTLVPVQTLNRILEENAREKTIHFMNIDVEGGEINVLHGLDLSRRRPWIILIEATMPTTSDPNFQAWEPLLTSHNYQFVYFDALNRFYIANEHAELAKHFQLPPNLFDSIVPAGQVVAQHQIHVLNTELAGVRSRTEELASELDTAYKTSQRLTLELLDTQASLKQTLTEKNLELEQIRTQLSELGARTESELVIREQELIAKENVIQNFRQSIQYSLIHGPYRHLPVIGKIHRRSERMTSYLKSLLMPHLGVLRQYAPKPFDIPARYFHVEKVVQPAPRISIVTPTYNYAHFLERTLKSVLHQGYPELEYIVQDGGSTDETITLVEGFKHQLKHFESRPDNGQANAINLGFRHASGEIMAYLNSDDVLLPGTLDYVANYFSTHPEVDVVYGHRLIIDENDRLIGDWIMPPHDGKALRWADYIPQETLFWHRRIWDKAGGRVDESFQFALDWDMLLRFQEAGAVFARLPRFLAAFRVHTEQKTSAQIADLGEKEAARLRLRTFGREVSYQEINRNIRSFLRRSIWHRLMHKLEIRKQKYLARRNQESNPAVWYQKESVYFYSLHKAGTSLFTHVLRHANELTHVDYETMLFDNKLPETITYEKYGHLYGVVRIVAAKHTLAHSKLTQYISTKKFVKDKTVVFLVRDPRDIIVSLYYSMGFTHVSSSNPQIENELQTIRDNLKTQELDEFALDRYPIIRERFEILYELSNSCKNSVVLRYEDLVNNFDKFMNDFSKYISIPEERKEELFQASRPRVSEDFSAHKRSGKIGQYREKLKPETIRELNQKLKPVLEKFGYDLDDVT